MSTNADTSNIADRVVRLERSLRRMRLLAGFFFIVASTICLAGAQSRKSDEIVLFDENGNARILLAAKEEKTQQPRIVFLTEDGQPTLSLSGCSKTSPSAISLYTHDGKPMSSLSHDPDGSSSQLSLHSREGGSRAFIGVEQKNGFVLINTQNGERRLK